MGSLNVVCLISGGKDSLFSILHCLQNGHKVVALANLHPPNHGNQEAAEDLDSYMYQTIGHAVIPLYEKALGLPLYRQEISGAAINLDKCYTPAGGHLNDETEALVPLLQRVKASHPEVNAVSTGAILSDYQRTRVESVALRLGLTPLSYLWQYPNLPPHSQTSLLEHMSAVGQDARIVKVASGGLDETFLWQNVADARTINRLRRAVQRFGTEDDGAVLGEGGEYETLAVAGPQPLWKARISVDENRREAVAGDAGSAFIRIQEASLDTSVVSSQSTSHVATPPLLEPAFEKILNDYNDDSKVNQEPGCVMSGRQDTSPQTEQIDTKEGEPCANTAGHLLLPNVTSTAPTLVDQVQAVMNQIKNSLSQLGRSFSDVVYTSIILRDMLEFANVNAVYGAHFLTPNPPARVTIACADVLPVGTNVMVAVTCFPANTAERRGLHVQSLSYWAPANIGPYSQATAVPMESNTDPDAALLYISGQIPLVPASMTLVSPPMSAEPTGFRVQAVLALQHLIRIGRTMQVRLWVGAIAFITAASPAEARARSKSARQVWAALHRANFTDGVETPAGDDDSGSFDVWDAKYGASQIQRYRQTESNDGQFLGTSGLHDSPRLYVIRVDALPRAASIEWAAYGMTECCSHIPRIPHLEHILRLFESHFC